MNIEKKIDGKTLILSLEGRLDTNTSKELENEITNLDGIEEVIFDFEKLEYISSSGLRVILKCKKNIDSTKIINCNTEVYEVFNVTGFTEMMQIEKALRKISIDNCEKIGEGFYGDIYRIDPETIVKVYKIPNPIDLINKERELSKKAFVMGIPTAISYDMVKVGDSYGSVFELLNAKTLVNLVTNEKELEDFAKKSANILKDMHSKQVDNGELPSRKEEVKNLLKRCEKSFSKEIYEKLVSLINSIKDTNNLLHCDFHVKNIMMQNDELLLIDMATLSIGHPIFEFASMYATYIGYSCIDKYNTDKFFGLPLNITTQLFNKIFKYYYDDKSEEELEDIKLKLSIISYIQILALRLKYTGVSNTSEQEIEFCINYLTENSKKLNTLDY